MSNSEHFFRRLMGKDAKYWSLYYLIDKTKLDRLVPDKLYLSLKFRCMMGKHIDWDHPQSFNEKLQWLKLFNRKSQYSLLVDKYTVKSIVSNMIGEKYIVPTLGVWDRFDDIDFENLPNEFVLKTTHSGGSSGVIVCKEKKTIIKNEAKIVLNK